MARAARATAGFSECEHLQTHRLRANRTLQRLPDSMRKAIIRAVIHSSNQYLIP